MKLPGNGLKESDLCRASLLTTRTRKPYVNSIKPDEIEHNFNL